MTLLLAYLNNRLILDFSPKNKLLAKEQMSLFVVKPIVIQIQVGVTELSICKSIGFYCINMIIMYCYILTYVIVRMWDTTLPI